MNGFGCIIIQHIAQINKKTKNKFYLTNLITFYLVVVSYNLEINKAEEIQQSVIVV